MKETLYINKSTTGPPNYCPTKLCSFEKKKREVVLLISAKLWNRIDPIRKGGQSSHTKWCHKQNAFALEGTLKKHLLNYELS